MRWIGIAPGKYFDWKKRFGKINQHNSWVPRDHWLTPEERQGIIKFHFDHPLEGYRRLTYMMLDADVVAVSPASVYRVLKQADLIGRSKTKPSRKGDGFEQFIRVSGMTHVKTSPYYPQSNGKLERYHRTIKSDCIRPGAALTLDDAKTMVTSFVKNYNEVRLHSAIDYITPLDKLLGREKAIFKQRNDKLQAARAARQKNRGAWKLELKQKRNTSQDASTCYDNDAWSEDRAMLRSNPSAAPSPETKIETAGLTSAVSLPSSIDSSSILAQCEKPTVNHQEH